jgi:hypothetical protein
MNITKYLDEWQRGKQYVDNFIRDFKRLDTIANAQYDGSSNKNPNIGDTTIAGIVRQVMRTAVKTLPVVQVAINGSKSTTEAIICRHIVNDCILNPTTFGKGFVNIMHLAGRGALTRGFSVFQVSATKMYGQYGVVPRLIHFNDFVIEPGVQDGSHSGYFYIRTKFTPSKLKRIYEIEKKKAVTTWNLKALKALIDIGPNSNGSTDYAEYLTEMEQNKQNADAETYDIITRFSSDSEQPVITFSPGINQELRSMPNKSKFGYPRVILLVIDPAELSPFGDSRVRLASPNQNFLMALRQNVATTWLYNSKPTMVKVGMFTGATTLKSGGVINAVDPNAKVSLLTLDTTTAQQFPTISQEITKQIQNMMGMNPGQSLGAIGGSKTGVGAQAQKQGIDDAVQQITNIIEELIRQYVTTALDMYIAEQDGDDVIYVSDEIREDILRLRPDAFPDEKNPNALAINWNQLYDYIKKINVEIDTTISKEDWTNEKRAELQDALTVMKQTSNPEDPSAQERIKQVEDKFLDETVPELAQTLKQVPQTPMMPTQDLTGMMQ